MSADALLTPAGAAQRMAGPAEWNPAISRAITRVITFAIYCLPILTFTTPGRPSPSRLAFLDGLAMVKLVVLLIVFFGGSTLMLALYRADPRKTFRILTPLIPFLLFLGWAIFSVLWSPLPAVTIGQSGGLASQLVMASLIGLTCHDRDSVERVLKSLSIMLILFSLFVFVLHLMAPNFSGLDRRMLHAGSDGVVHPTAAGANASLGLLVGTYCYFIGRYRWAYRMLIVSVLIHGVVMFYSSSRTALGMAFFTIPIILFLNTSNPKRALMFLAPAGLVVAFLLFDPGFQAVLDSNSSSVQYITRGQSADQLKGISGRSEMWTKVWNEYTKSPAIGHGYFITSEKGAIEVWYMTANHTAHNIYLQVLAGTGAIGLLLLLIAIAKPYLAFQTLRRRDELARQVFQMLIFIFIWYLGWSLLCASFMGPVRSESVVFFAFLGLGVGQLARFDPSSGGKSNRAESSAVKPGAGTGLTAPFALPRFDTASRVIMLSTVSRRWAALSVSHHVPFR